MGIFDDLVPNKDAQSAASSSLFDDLVPKAQNNSAIGTVNTGRVYNDVGSSNPIPVAPNPYNQAQQSNLKPLLSVQNQNDRQYAKDVFNTPSLAVAKYLSKAAHGLGIDDDATYNYIQKQVQQESQNKAQDRLQASHPFLTDIVANPITYALPGAGVGASMGAKVGLAALGGGAYSALDPNATLGSVALGTGLGAVTPYATKLIGAGINKVADVVAGHFPDAIQKLEDLGKQYGVNLTAGMLNPATGKVEEKIGMVPFSGLDPIYNETQAQTKVAAENLVNELQAKIGLGNSADDIARASFAAKHAADTAIGHAKYDNVSALAGNTTALPTTNLESELQAQQLENLKQLVPNQALDKEYQNSLERLNTAQPGGVSNVVPLAGSTPGAPIPPVVDNSYDGLHNMATYYWKKAQGFEPGTPEYANNMALSSAARKDLDSFASNSGNPALQEALDEANSFWKNTVKRYSGDSNDPTEATWAAKIKGSGVNPQAPMDYFIQPGQAGRANYYYNGLNETGRDAVRSGIIQDAYTKSLNTDSAFSPGRFASEIKKNDAAVSVFFPGESKTQIEDIAKVLQAAKNTVLSNGNIRTGWTGAQMASTATGLGGALGAGTAALMGAGGAATALTAAAPVVGLPIAARLAIKGIFNTDAGKRLLLNVGGMAPGSQALYNTVANQLPRVINASIAASNPLKSEEDYNNLPIGAAYTALDGTKGVKQ